MASGECEVRVKGIVSWTYPYFGNSHVMAYGVLLVTDGETETLTSYLTDVARVKDGKLTLLPAWNSSATTYRHVVEFAKQTGTYEQLVEAKKGVRIGHGNYPWLR